MPWRFPVEQVDHLYLTYAVVERCPLVVNTWIEISWKAKADDGKTNTDK